MKRIIPLLLAAALLCAPAFAWADGAWLDDQAGLLSAAQAEALEARIQSLYEQYDMAYGIVTADDFGGKTPEAYADDYFDYEGMGYGDNHDGMVFVLNMVSRDMHLSTHAKGISVLNDAEIARILSDCGTHFANGDVEAGLNKYLDLAVYYTEEYLRAQDGSGSVSYGADDPGDQWLRAFYIALPVSLVIALIVLCIMLVRHRRSLPMAPSSIVYVGEMGAEYTHEVDMFLHTYTSRTEIPKDDNGGGGGTSTHTSSSGETHGGGGAKF